MTVTPEERAEIRRLRKDKDLSQEEVAEKIGASPATISNVETGRHPQMAAVLYARLMKLLKFGELDNEAEARFKKLVGYFPALDAAQQEALVATAETFAKIAEKKISK